jgi:tetratricopeptide (TPR) repeat protein
MSSGPDSIDPDTLRERYDDLAAAQARAESLRRDVREAPDAIAELVARGDLVELLRGLGELDEALREADAAVDRAEIAGTPAQQHTARVRLAHVHQQRGEFGPANLLFTELLPAAARFGPVIEAYTHQRAGLNDLDQRHWHDANDHFARALAIGTELELPEDDLVWSRLGLSVTQQHLEDT